MFSLCSVSVDDVEHNSITFYSQAFWPWVSNCRLLDHLDLDPPYSCPSKSDYWLEEHLDLADLPEFCSSESDGDLRSTSTWRTHLSFVRVRATADLRSTSTWRIWISLWEMLLTEALPLPAGHTKSNINWHEINISGIIVYTLRIFDWEISHLGNMISKN